MSSQSRESSRDRAESRLVRHQHSFSESGRSSIPMWDSSDPDRAPPPLPLNPGLNSNSPITKPNVSSTIEKAAALIASRAIDNAPSAYTSNPPPPSADRNLIKPHHRRMQTIQTGPVGRLSDSLERRSPDKGLSRSKLSDLDDYRSSRSQERSPTRSGSETPTPPGKDTQGHKSLSDENTPPSSNMLALQSVRNRQEFEIPFSDMTNGSSILRSSMSLESLSTQILNITSIATNLQREMTNLSRRSKDNATDLVSLKDATNSRDEDIRKSLKDLRISLDSKFTSIDARMLSASDASRSTPNLGLYLDDKMLDTPTRKTYAIPRIASPSLIDRDITASPSVVSVDGAASIALLEKVLREMATKDGQERIMSTLETVRSNALGRSSQALTHNPPPMIDPKMMQKLEEILMFMQDMKEDAGSKALVRAGLSDNTHAPSQIEMYLDADRKANSVTKIRQEDGRRGSNMGSPGADFISEEVMKILRSVKQSLSQNGGLTNEVKTLVRDLRGEVLGMGREIAKKLDETDLKTCSDRQDASVAASQEVSRIVDQGLAELKEHMHQITEESRRQADHSARSIVDTQEVVSAVQRAMEAMPRAEPQAVRDVAAEREELLAAVKEAWEDCKPEIALEHFGLERDEILETLKEGLKSYQPQQPLQESTGVSYEEVLDAVQQGLADFRPPEIQVQPNISKEEIISTVRQCLDDYDFPTHLAPSQVSGSELSRDDVLDAVREVLSLQVAHPRSAELTREDVAEAVRVELANQGQHTKEIEFNRDDLFDAIKACLEGEQNPLGGMGERVIESMHEFLSSMKVEFQQYSAANGRDTEQVLDALKDGLEELRAEVESYVDRAADVTGKDEIIDTVKAGFAAMQVDMDKGFANRVQQAPNTPELLDAMEKEFEHLRDTISKTLNREAITTDKDDILDAIRDMGDGRRSLVGNDEEDIARHVKEELEHMRKTLAETLIRSSASLDRDEVLDTIREGIENSRAWPKADGNESILSNTSELLDAFQDGVEGIRADMRKILAKDDDQSANYEILDALRAGVESLRSDIQRLHDRQSELPDTQSIRGNEIMLHEGTNINSEIEALKVMITQLRNKIEALDGMPGTQPVIPSKIRMHEDDLDEIHGAIREVHESVRSAPASLHKDDFDSIHAAIREVHGTVQGVCIQPQSEEINGLHAAIKEVQESVQKFEFHAREISLPVNAASKEDVDAIETLLRNVKAQLDNLVMPDLGDSAKVSHIDSIESLLREIKASVEASATGPNGSSSNEDFSVLGILLRDVQSAVEDLPLKINGISDEDKRLTKTDLQVLETICLDMKEKLEVFSLPDIEYLASREDLHEMKEHIKAFREQFEADNDLTAQAFEARKIEHGGLANKIDDVKNIIVDVREELVGKLNGSEEGIVELAKVLGMHHDNMSTYATATSISELSELLTKGFDSYGDHHASSKAEMEERDATMFSKHEEISAELKIKIEDKFSELILKYDDAQLASENRLKALDDHNKTYVEATTSVKSVVDEIRSLVGAVGTTVSEACERMSDDARTVFEKVDESNARIGELHTTTTQEHVVTRDEIAKTLAAASRVEDTLQEHHPTVMAAIQEVLDVVAKHYEHSQEQGESFKAATEEIKSNVNAIPSAIPPLLPAIEASHEPSIIEMPAQKEYDDSEVQAKLNELLEHANTTREAFDNMENHHKTMQGSLVGLDGLESLSKLDKLEKLDLIHEQVRSAAAEISSLLGSHTKLITAHHESRAEEAREAAIALEKRSAQKECVEAEIIALTREKNALAESMAALRREHEDLNSQTKKLTREVAKLETALTMRQAEMGEMNARAESLERRVLEGVMNHARSLNLAKPPSRKKMTPAERDASMSLKRVASTSSNMTAKAPSVTGSNTVLGSAVGLALKKKTGLSSGLKSSKAGRTSNADRRILSTSHVTGGRPSDAHRTLVLAPALNTGLVSLKRSHSVKSNPSGFLHGRKPSWNGADVYAAEKENQTQLEEEDIYREAEEDMSDSGTERRSSFTDTYSDSLTYGTGSAISRNSMRSASYTSSVGGAIRGQNGSILEEDDEDDEDEDEDDYSDGEADERVSAKDFALTLAKAPGGGRNLGARSDLSALEEPELFDEVGDLPNPGEPRSYAAKYTVPSDSGIGSEPDGSQTWRNTASG